MIFLFFLQEVIVSDNPLLLESVYGNNSDSLKAYFYCNQKLVEIDYDILTESEICELFVHIRLKTQLPLICELSSESIFEAVNALQKKVISYIILACTVTLSSECLSPNFRSQGRVKVNGNILPNQNEQ